jgi:hypothetical protein
MYRTKGEIDIVGYYDVELPKIPIILDDVRCRGSESSLIQCPNTGIANHNCVHYEDIVLDCRGCIETKVRLFGGKTPYDGRVEICVNDHWVSLCAENWDDRHAAVVCRQLGHNTTSYAVHMFGGSMTMVAVKVYKLTIIPVRATVLQESRVSLLLGVLRLRYVCLVARHPMMVE